MARDPMANMKWRVLNPDSCTALIPLTEVELDTLARILRLHTGTANKTTRAVLRRVLEKIDHATLVPR
jgi:hypothetical protein